MLVIMNSPALTSWGRYSWRPLSIEAAKRILRSRPFVSTIGHEGTATFLSDLLGIEIPANRIKIEMGPNLREAIVIQLMDRLPEGKVLSAEELRSVKYRLGLMKWRKA